MLEVVDHSNGARTGTSWYYAPYRQHGLVLDWTLIELPSDVTYYDPMMDVMRLLEFRSPRVSMLELAGWNSPVQALSTSQVFGYRPSVYDLPAKLNKLHTLSQVLRFLSGSTSQVDDTEHDIAHFNLVGRVHEGAYDSPYTGNYGVFHTACTVDSSHTSYSHTGTLPGGVALPTLTVQDLPSIVADVDAGVHDLIVNPGVSVFVRDLRFVLDDGGLSIVKYKLIYGAYGSPGDGISNWLWYKEVEVAYGIVWEYTNTPPTEYFTLYDRSHAMLYKSVHCVKHYARALGSTPDWYLSPIEFGSKPDEWPDAGQFSGNAVWHVSKTPTYGWQEYSGISGFQGSIKQNTGQTSYITFRQESETILNDLLVMGFQAQGDAWDNNIVILKTNILEFLTEVGEISSLLSSPTDIILGLAESYKKLNSGKGILSVMRRFLGLLSDATLFYSFMLRPNVMLAAESAAKASRLHRSFDSFFGWQTIYGEASYTIGDELPQFAGSTCVGRSKMRVRIPPDSALAAVLPFEKLGLLPGASRYWETLRLSFLIDWFFNVKSKLDVIDKTMRFMALDVQYVTNSVTLYKSINENGFMVEDGTAYKYYARWSLPESQTFTPTRLAILGASGPPSWLVAGSLFYKLS